MTMDHAGPVKRVYILDSEPLASDVRATLEMAGYAVVGVPPSHPREELLAPPAGSAPVTPLIARARSRSQSDLDRRLLLRIGEAMHGASDGIELLREVSTELGSYLEVARCHFLQIDAATDQMIVHPGYVTDPIDPPINLALSAFGREAAAASARGETLVLDDVCSDARTAAQFEAAYARIHTRAFVSVPLMRGRQWVAALAVASTTPRAWQEREVALIRLVAQSVWPWVERLRVEGDLQRSQARFHSFVDDVKEYAIFMLDAAGHVATWNAGAQRLHGYRADEVVGAPQSVFYPTGDAERARAVLDSAVRAGRYEEEGWRVRKDGGRFWASVVVTPTFQRDGALEGFALITRDFTDRRRHEDDLRLQQAKLAQRLREREALVQELDHRVKNNLQVMTSLISMQMRKLQAGGAREALAECRARVLAIAFAHDQLYRTKDYARVRVGDYLRGLIAHVVQSYELPDERVALELAVAEVPLGIDRAVPCALVINELLGNALRHAFPGERRGTVRVELTELEDSRVCLAVRDDGVGLPPGFDIRNATSMGLQLVATLAEQLEAMVAVSGGAGAAFELTFAIAAAG